MKGYLKKILTFIVLPVCLYFGYRLVNKILTVKDLSASLENYLDNLYDAKPSINATILFRAVVVKITFKNSEGLNLEQIKLNCIEYVENFYPAINLKEIDFEIR